MEFILKSKSNFINQDKIEIIIGSIILSSAFITPAIIELYFKKYSKTATFVLITLCMLLVFICLIFRYLNLKRTDKDLKKRKNEIQGVLDEQHNIEIELKEITYELSNPDWNKKIH